jgi:hypothetical protein
MIISCLSDADESDVPRRGIDRLRMARSQPIASAIVGGAEMRMAPLVTLRGSEVLTYPVRGRRSAARIVATLPQCGRAGIMQAVNATVKSRKCLPAIMLTYSFWQCNKRRDRAVITLTMSIRCIGFGQRAALHLLAAFISKMNVV